VGVLEGRPASASWRDGALEGDPEVFVRHWTAMSPTDPWQPPRGVVNLLDVLPAFDQVTRVEMLVVRTPDEGNSAITDERSIDAPDDP
jgi:hypothetical protein